jgi:hypothetical protein
MEATIRVNRDALVDLVRVKEEFDTIIESLECMNDKAFMDSYNKSKKQIKKKEFDDWNEL